MVTITNIGVETAARMLANVSPVAAFTYLATGTSSVAEAPDNGSLGAENTLYGAERAAATCSFVSPGTTQWTKLFTFSGAVTIREVGVFNASISGNMFLRLLLAQNKTYSDGESVQITIANVASRV